MRLLGTVFLINGKEQTVRGAIALAEAGDINAGQYLHRRRIEHKNPPDEVLEHPPATALDVGEGEVVVSGVSDGLVQNDDVLGSGVHALNERVRTQEDADGFLIKCFDDQRSQPPREPAMMYTDTQP